MNEQENDLFNFNEEINKVFDTNVIDNIVKETVEEIAIRTKKQLDADNEHNIVIDNILKSL